VVNDAAASISGATFGILSQAAIINAINVTNSGKIEATGTAAGTAGIAIGTSGTATVNNLSGGIIAANGQNGVAILGQAVIVTGNAGTIEAGIGAGITGGVAIKADTPGGTADVSNAGSIQASSIAIVTDGLLTLNNTGSITSGGSFAVLSNNGNVNVNQNITGDTGTISAIAAGGIAIQALNGTATVSNIGDGVTTGIITADTSAIFANAVNVTNTGLIQANANGGITISAHDDVTVNNFGLIEQKGNGGATIKAGGIATVSNSSSGVIRANGGAVTTAIAGSSMVNVTDNSGRIEATNGFAINTGGVATVNNSLTGVITSAFGITAGTNADIVNAGLIEATGSGFAIFASGTANITNTGRIQALGNTAIFGNTVIVDNRIGGQITGLAAFAIGANTVNVTANAGTIEGTGANRAAIFAANATVNNVSGGTISGGESGIKAGIFDVTNATGATISGGINGIEGVTIAGSGTVRNAGTISGGTNSVKFIGTGTNTLTLLTGSVLIGDAVGSALAGATNKLILQGSGTVDNHFMDFNTLDVEASGAWVWNSNSAIDATTVNSGTLVVDSVLAGPVTVNSGGTLAGHGIISGDISVASGATVAPGAAVPFSTLNASGNVSFQPGSVFRVNANAAGQSDKLAITGSATLTGGTVTVLAGGSFAPSSSTPYTILTTTNVNGLGGTTFASVTTNLAFLTPSLSYTANDVTLTLATATGGTGDPGGGDPGGGGTGGGTTGGGTGGGGTASTGFGFAAVTQTRNQRAVATALDRGPVSNPLIIAVLNQTVAGARQAFDALSGEVFGSVHNAQGQEAQFARSAMLGRMRQSSYAGIPGDLGALGFGGPALAYAAGDTSSADSASAAYATKAAPGARGPSRDLTFWAQGLGGWGHADSDGNAASLKSRFGGFLSGVDARFGDTLRAGFVAGYMRSDLNVDARASSAGIDSVQLGAYAAGRLGAFNVRGGGSYSLDSIDTSRTIIFPGFTDKASARFHGNVGQVFGEVGYGMAFGSVAVEPLAGLAYVHVRDGSFRESGGVAALSGASANENTGYSFVGVRAATFVPLANGTMLVPRGTLQWQHAFGDVVPASALAFQGTGAAFSVAGIPIARDTALVEGGFDWRFAPQAKLGAFYQGELAAHAQTHAVKGAFTWDF
jgi:fibronectin-binding autotransporter adhesin